MLATLILVLREVIEAGLVAGIVTLTRLFGRAPDKKKVAPVTLGEPF